MQVGGILFSIYKNISTETLRLQKHLFSIFGVSMLLLKPMKIHVILLAPNWDGLQNSCPHLKLSEKISYYLSY